MAYNQDLRMVRLTINNLAKMRAEGTRIAMLTCYDAAFAGLLDEAGVDMLLIGGNDMAAFAGVGDIGIQLTDVDLGVALPTERVEKRIHAAPNDPDEIGNDNKLLRKGAEAKGWKYIGIVDPASLLGIKRSKNRKNISSLSGRRIQIMITDA